MTVLIVLGAVLAAVILYLCVLIFTPVLRLPAQPVKKNLSEYKVPPGRADVSFAVEECRISGWFYKTMRSEKAPCIVMAHGFGGTKDMALESYALRFNEAGYSVLTFDYRYFGESEGSPRQLHCGPWQLEDIKTAIAYARSREDVDEGKIIIWGTSAGAPYTIVTAAKDPAIAAVIGQCGSWDHKEDSRLYIDREGWGFFFKLFVHAQKDKGRSRFGLSPHTFPAYGKPGTIAMLNSPGALEGIEKLAEHSATFVNEVCARLAFMPHIPDPIELAKDVKCPVHIAVCLKDGIVSPVSHVRLVDGLSSTVEVKEYPVEHFDIYSGEYFEKSIGDQISFLKKNI